MSSENILAPSQPTIDAGEFGRCLVLKEETPPRSIENIAGRTYAVFYPESDRRLLLQSDKHMFWWGEGLSAQFRWWKNVPPNIDERVDCGELGYARVTAYSTSGLFGSLVRITFYRALDIAV